MKSNSKRIRRITNALIFILFSGILFLNNSTQILDKLNVSYNFNTIAWIGIVLSVIYALWLESEGKIWNS